MKRTALRLAIFAALAGCATMQTFSTRQELERAPYYQTYADFSIPEGAAIGHLPIRMDNQADVIGSARVLAPLLDAMNRYLDAAGWTTKLLATPSARFQAPWAYVGSAAGLNARTHLLADSAIHPVMVIQALGPSRNWANELRTIADQQHLEGVLVIALGPADHFLREHRERERRDVERRKELELGTGYVLPVEWLNAADHPVQVLQITGLLLSRDGTVLRAGAEGIFAKRPAFDRSVVNLAFALTDEDVASIVSSLRRDDLPGQPLAWQVALEHLVRQLLRSGEEDPRFRRRAP